MYALTRTAAFPIPFKLIAPAGVSKPAQSDFFTKRYAMEDEEQEFQEVLSGTGCL